VEKRRLSTIEQRKKEREIIEENKHQVNVQPDVGSNEKDVLEQPARL